MAADRFDPVLGSRRGGGKNRPERDHVVAPRRVNVRALHGVLRDMPDDETMADVTVELSAALGCPVICLWDFDEFGGYALHIERAGGELCDLPEQLNDLLHYQEGDYGFDGVIGPQPDAITFSEHELSPVEHPGFMSQHSPRQFIRGAVRSVLTTSSWQPGASSVSRGRFPHSGEGPL